jgi:hypothetical protein
MSNNLKLLITESQAQTIFKKIVSEQIDNEKTRQKYVGDDKKVSHEDFHQILEVSGGKPHFVLWLTKSVTEGLILPEDIYKFKEYFTIFEKNKAKFDIKDIIHYKTKEQIEAFKQKCIEIKESHIKHKDIIDNKDKYVSLNNIDKLKAVGIKYLGVSEGYQVFEVPNELKGNENAWKVYKNILGKCAGREQGADLSICTFATFDHFNNYLSHYPGSSYFVLYNLGDRLSPYQVHFESAQFMDKDDKNYF